MSNQGRILSIFLILGMLTFLGVQSKSQVVSKNVNMVSGTKLPGGDPFLQRQNEPSLAVSTRNPMHLLAGANDYRTVDMPHYFEYIPNYGGETAAPGDRDAWLGVFKSTDGGESWFSTLLPGFPQDQSFEGRISPLKSYSTAADPVVRAGTNGMFYYSGIAFIRGGPDPTSQQGAVFISRYIDNNDQETGDPIQYIDTKIIHIDPGNGFIDKPWIVVDLPRQGQGTMTLHAPNVPAQQIHKHSIYLVYTLFEEPGDEMHSTIYIVHSENCGETWSEPFPISQPNTINQGAVLAINQENGKVYVAWRRFAAAGEYDAILMACFGPQGQYFEPPVVVAEMLPFDQPTLTTSEGLFSFRTNSYPTIAVDNLHNIHLAWAQRTQLNIINWPSRIMISHSTNGKDWTVPVAVDNCDQHLHQFMPSLSYAGSRLALIWYDQRYDLNQSLVEYITDEIYYGLITHTIDLRVAVAESTAHPIFGASQRLTKFLHVIDPLDTGSDVQEFQAEYHYPNLPLFMKGTAPFLGDYIDLAPLTFILKNDKMWTFNDDPDLALFHASWADNRDVVPPPDGNWEIYTPPNSDQEPEFAKTAPEEECIPERTGMRNQNIYTAVISGGLVVGAPGNAKPLNIQRAFVVFVKNETNLLKTYRLTIDSSGPEASFLQFEDLDTLDVEVAPFSSVARTVYVDASTSKDTVRVDIDEVGGALSSYVLINADPSNPNVRNPNVRNPNVRNPNVRNYEVYNPNVRNPNVRNTLLTNENILNPNVRNYELQNTSIVNPNVRNDDLLNPNVRNADLTNPNVRNDHLLNPNVRNESIGDPSEDPNPEIDDYTWVIRNDGNTTAAYMSSAVTNHQVPDGIHLQLLIYKVHTAPTANEFCELKEEHHDELLANITDPEFYDSWDNPNVRNPNVRNPNVRNASFYLAPGEEAWITLRVYDPDTTDSESFDPSLVEIAATAQAVNTQDVENGQTEPSYATSVLMVQPLNLPIAHLNLDYSASVSASGGELPYSWVELGTSLSTIGLTLNNDGTITGVPNSVGTVSFTAQVTDQDGSGISATGDYEITVIDPLIIVTTVLPDAYKGSNYTTTLSAVGGTSLFTWTQAGGSLPNGLSLNSDGSITGKPSSIGIFTFTAQVVDSSTTAQTTVKTLQLSVAEIVESWVSFYDGGFPDTVFKKTSNDMVLDSGGNLYVVGRDLNPRGGDTDIFLMKYDNFGQPVNGFPVIFDHSGFDDEGLAVAVDSSSNVYVAGFIGTSSNGKDYMLLKFSGDGTYQWDRTYNEPFNGNDEAVDIVVDSTNDYIYITGTSTGTGGEQGFCTIGYDSSGNLLGSYPVRKDISGKNLTAVALALDGTGNLYVAGHHEDAYVINSLTATTGAQNGSWPVTLDVGGTDELRAMAFDGTDIIIAGMSNGGTTEMDFVTAKYNTAGALQWGPVRFDGYGYHDEPYAMTVDASGNIFVTGRSDINGGTSPLSDFGTVAYDNTGTELWTAFYDGPTAEQDVATAMGVATGNLYVAGYSDGQGTSYDYALVKYTYSGSSVTEQWIQRYDHRTHFNDSITALVMDDVNPVVTGHVVDQGDDHIVTLKYDPSGNQIWHQDYHGQTHAWGDPSRGLSLDSDGNIYASGPSYVDGNGYDFALTKYNPSGDALWSIPLLDFSGNGDDWVVDNELDGQGYIYISGRVLGDGQGFNFGLAKYSTSDGAPQWHKEYNGPANKDEWLGDIAVDESGNVYMTGECDFTSGLSERLVTVKYDSNGNLIWDNRWSSQESWGHAIALDNDGYVYVGGAVRTLNGDFDVIVVKYDASGGSIVSGFPVTYDNTSLNDVARDLVVDQDGNIYVTGFSVSNTGRDYITIKFDENGNKLWEARYDGPNHASDHAVEIELDDSGNVYVTGVSIGINTLQDIATIKYDTDGSELWVARYDGPTHNIESVSYTDFPLVIDKHGNVYIACISYTDDLRKNDAVVTMYDSKGNLIWSKSFNSSYSHVDNAHAIKLDSKGNVIISVSSYTFETRGDRVVVKYVKKK